MSSRIKGKLIFATVLGLSGFSFLSAEETAFRDTGSHVEVTPQSNPESESNSDVVPVSAIAEPYWRPTEVEHLSDDEVNEYLT